MQTVYQNSAWHARHPWMVYVFWAIIGPIFVWDVILVEILNVPSISSRIWSAEGSHATIRVAITLSFVLIGYLVRSNLWAFALSMILLGHLALNE